MAKSTMSARRKSSGFELSNQMESIKMYMVETKVLNTLRNVHGRLKDPQYLHTSSLTHS